MFGSFSFSGLRIASRLNTAEQQAVAFMDGGDLPASSWAYLRLKDPLAAAMREEVGALEYWEWRVPENFILTDLRNQRGAIAEVFGLAPPETWEEFVGLAVTMVRAMRSSPEMRKALIDMEQSDEEAERAESKLRTLRRIAIPLSIIGIGAGIAGVAAAAAGNVALQRENQDLELELAEAEALAAGARPIFEAEISERQAAGISGVSPVVTAAKRAAPWAAVLAVLYVFLR